MQPDALGPTSPAHPPVAPSRPQTPPSGRTLLAAAAAAALLAGLLIGIAIGRATKRSDAPAQPQTLFAQLGVTSKPVDANVTVDGRFVGVSPLDRIDLDPGKHTVVIDAFGYQPYAGTVEVESRARTTLKVTLAPIGGTETTNGQVVGAKRASNAVVPATALAPVSLTGTGTSKDAKPPRTSPASGTSSSSSSAPRPPPSRPRRDCSGEKSQCRSSCSSAESSCRFACPGCTSCLTSVGWDECKRQCDSCRQGCEQNVKFCESSCESNYSSCSASQ